MKCVSRVLLRQAITRICNNRANAGQRPAVPMSDNASPKFKENVVATGTWGSLLGWIAAWAWTVVAGGGGLLLLLEKGPWPLTNGWFALLSGIVACPFTSWFLEKHTEVTISGRVRFAAAALLFIAGRIALAYTEASD